MEELDHYGDGIVTDAVVVGAGPNGLAAAVVLARAGLSVEVLEGAEQPGGGCRTAELTLEGFHHDVCSAVHPLLIASPFFKDIDLEKLGVRLCTPKVSFAHPLDGGRAGVAWPSIEKTAEALGPDARRYRRLFAPLARDLDKILPTVLAPLRSVPSHPLAMARFGTIGLLPATRVAARFQTDEAKGIVAGASAHSMLSLSSPLSASFGLLFIAVAHRLGWPVVSGGSQRIVEALGAELESLGGRIRTGAWVRRLDELDAKTVLLDVTPRQFLDLAGDRLKGRPRRQLERFRYGPGVCKVDWALSGPVPWQAEACREAGTVHVCGPFDEVARSEAAVAAGRHAEKPFVLVAQPGVVDPTRAPEGQHTLWGYCHVPHGSTTDMTGAIEGQIERFAPGFRDLILARSTMTAADMAHYDPNYIGGDINGGLANLRQTVLRPTARWNPYRTALPGVYLCSASTPPGGGVHGMCGLGAARTALADLGRR
ncbi:MAG: phytoene desaturase family protein [Acidimicrobiales bacterium]